MPEVTLLDQIQQRQAAEVRELITNNRALLARLEKIKRELASEQDAVEREIELLVTQYKELLALAAEVPGGHVQ